MASENSRRLQQALAPALKQRGFKKAGATWRKASADAIGVLNLQGSQWGPSFYINLGVYLRALGDSDQPTEYHCHVRTRLTDLVPDRERLNALLDFEKPVGEDVRVRELETAVVEHALPWLDTVSTLEGAREYCSSQAPNSPWVTKEARAFLETTHGASYGRNASYPAPPAQTRTCSFPASGSSVVLAFASNKSLRKYPMQSL